MSSEKKSKLRNKFVQNEEKTEKDKKYNYYIKPCVNFWSDQTLTFELINQIDDIPKQRDPRSGRYVLQKLLTTWNKEPPNDKDWFDLELVFNSIKDELISRLGSEMLKSDPSKCKFLFRFIKYYAFLLILLVLSVKIMLIFILNSKKKL